MWTCINEETHRQFSVNSCSVRALNYRDVISQQQHTRLPYIALVPENTAIAIQQINLFLYLFCINLRKQRFGEWMCKPINPSVRIFHTQNYKRDFNEI
jgi:hypothetical protein